MASRCAAQQSPHVGAEYESVGGGVATASTARAADLPHARPFRPCLSPPPIFRFDSSATVMMVFIYAQICLMPYTIAAILNAR